MTNSAHVAPVLPGEDSRARRVRGQGGSVLIFVLAVITMLTLGVVSTLFVSQSMFRTSVKLEETATNVHDIDGAMEYAVNTVRRTTDMCNGELGNGEPGNPLQVVHIGSNGDFESKYDVFCEASVVPSGMTPPDPNEPVRYVDLRVARSSGVTDGKARIRVFDGGATGDPGYMLVVCDWVLTGPLVAEVGALDWCPPAEEL